MVVIIKSFRGVNIYAPLKDFNYQVFRDPERATQQLTRLLLSVQQCTGLIDLGQGLLLPENQPGVAEATLAGY